MPDTIDAQGRRDDARSPSRAAVAFDGHVHSEWSWDARHGDMLGTCEAAVRAGMRSVAFTEHADFTRWMRADDARADDAVPPGTRLVDAPSGDGFLDVDGYLRVLEACRDRYPSLRIVAGVELGEAHRFPGEVQRLVGDGRFERVLCSLHCIPDGDLLLDMSAPGMLADDPAGIFGRYLAEELEMVRSVPSFDVLAHLDYAKRFWPEGVEFDERPFEEEYRAVLEAAIERGVALEINSKRGRDPVRDLCPGPLVVRWFAELGGESVTLGSDAHRPEHLAAGLDVAADVARAAGFEPEERDATAPWRR